MADINATINSLTSILNTAQTKLKADQDKFDANTVLVNEYLRQIEYHKSLGNFNDADNVAITLNNTYISRKALQDNLAASQASFDNAKADLDAAVANLTPAQQSELTAQTNIALANATERALKQKAEADKQNFAQKNVQYLIIGGVILVIIIVTIMIIRKRKKSKLL